MVLLCFYINMFVFERNICCLYIFECKWGFGCSMAEYQIYTISESENESEIIKLNQVSKRRRYKNSL